VTFVSYWFSDLVTYSTWANGAAVVALGLSPSDAIWIVFIAAMCGWSQCIEASIWNHPLESSRHHCSMAGKSWRPCCSLFLRCNMGAGSDMRQHICEFGLLWQWYVLELRLDIRARLMVPIADITSLFPKYFNIRRGIIFAMLVSG
jgi:cytosine/uracil/thiamine/allantoin permease